MQAKGYSSATKTDVDQAVNALSYQVVGAALEVHKALGPGFLESVYEDALCVEMQQRGIPYKQQYPVAVQYKGRLVGENRLDLLVGDSLVVELKAVDRFAPIHTAQILSYLKATQLRLGLLINFNVVLLKKQGIKRIIL